VRHPRADSKDKANEAGAGALRVASVPTTAGTRNVAVMSVRRPRRPRPVMDATIRSAPSLLVAQTFPKEEMHEEAEVVATTPVAVALSPRAPRHRTTAGAGVTVMPALRVAAEIAAEAEAEVATQAAVMPAGAVAAAATARCAMSPRKQRLVKNLGATSPVAAVMRGGERSAAAAVVGVEMTAVETIVAAARAVAGRRHLSPRPLVRTHIRVLAAARRLSRHQAAGEAAVASSSRSRHRQLKGGTHVMHATQEMRVVLVTRATHVMPGTLLAAVRRTDATIVTQAATATRNLLLRLLPLQTIVVAVGVLLAMRLPASANAMTSEVSILLPLRPPLRRCCLTTARVAAVVEAAATSVLAMKDNRAPVAVGNAADSSNNNSNSSTAEAEAGVVAAEEAITVVAAMDADDACSRLLFASVPSIFSAHDVLTVQNSCSVVRGVNARARLLPVLSTPATTAEIKRDKIGMANRFTKGTV
jgi:hypothetical protein